jgi:hypothetical protein
MYYCESFMPPELFPGDALFSQNVHPLLDMKGVFTSKRVVSAFLNNASHFGYSHYVDCLP